MIVLSFTLIHSFSTLRVENEWIRVNDSTITPNTLTPFDGYLYLYEKVKNDQTPIQQNEPVPSTSQSSASTNQPKQNKKRKSKEQKESKPAKISKQSVPKPPKKPVRNQPKLIPADVSKNPDWLSKKKDASSNQPKVTVEVLLPNCLL